ncbi:MAG: DUF4166 domain-containing protein [Sphingorhabdus sp.]
MAWIARHKVKTQPLKATEPLYDSRFRQLVGREDWAMLRPAIQRRFSKRLIACGLALYTGEIVETQRNMAGRTLATICRIIGAPLPLYNDRGVPAVVIVSEDMQTGGQRWTRIYHRNRGAPQIINSAKAFTGKTGLEEWIGGGFGMALTIEAAPDRLSFRSQSYFFAIGKLRIALPRWLSPGETLVTHRDLGEGRFAFDLRLTHPLFGLLIAQHALFRDQP